MPPGSSKDVTTKLAPFPLALVCSFMIRYFVTHSSDYHEEAAAILECVRVPNFQTRPHGHGCERVNERHISDPFSQGPGHILHDTPNTIPSLQQRECYYKALYYLRQFYRRNRQLVNSGHNLDGKRTRSTQVRNVHPPSFAQQTSQNHP